MSPPFYRVAAIALFCNPLRVAVTRNRAQKRRPRP